MNGRRLLMLTIAGLVLVALIVMATSAYWERKKPLFQNGPELIAALHAFSRDEILRGRSVPPEISVADLVSRGYLSTNDVTLFCEMGMTFFTTYDANQRQSILASVPAGKDGFTCLLADGSVQQFSRERLEQYRLQLIEKIGGAKTNTSGSNKTAFPR